MKSILIDSNNSEAFIKLPDDSIIKVPFSQLSAYNHIGSNPNINSLSGNYGYCNNHMQPLQGNNIENL